MRVKGEALRNRWPDSRHVEAVGEAAYYQGDGNGIHQHIFIVVLWKQYEDNEAQDHEKVR